MTKSEEFNLLFQEIYHGSSVENILAVLQNFNQDLSKTIPIEENYELQAHAFQRMRELTIDDPNIAEPLILNFLLPICLEDSLEARIMLSRLRSCLEEWIYQYREHDLYKLRDKTLKKVIPHLDHLLPEVRAACWTVSHIGYRTEKVYRALWNILKMDDSDIGDIATSVLVSLGARSKDREKLIPIIHERIKVRFNSSLSFALARIGDPSSLDVIISNWLINPKDLKSIDKYLVFSTIGFILDANFHNHDWQDKAILKLTNLAESQENGIAKVHFGDLGKNCNSSYVVPTLLSWIADEEPEEETTAWGSYLIESRLSECIRPSQLLGWIDYDNKEVINNLLEKACEDTEYDVFAPTQAAMIKESAWETLFRMGTSEVLNWYEQAVVNETGRFLQQKITEMFACIKIEPLPKHIHKWIYQDNDLSDAGGDGREYARPLSATRLARSAATTEAFDILLRFGFRYGDDALLESSDALAEVALNLICQEEISIVKNLVDHILEINNPDYQRAAAANALNRIAAYDSSLITKYIDELIPAIFETKRKPWERSSMIDILGYLSDWNMSEKLLVSLLKWACEPDRWIGGSALNTLIRRGVILQYPDLLIKQLGLERVGNKWDISLDSERFEWASFSIGLLYNDQPDQFCPAIVAIIRSLDWNAVVQILRWVVYAHKESIASDVSKDIIDALIDRINSKHSSFYAETELFSTLADIAPSYLCLKNWDENWASWLPEARIALANALISVNCEVKTTKKAVLLLQKLAQDGRYEVRRTAYRGLAHQSQDALLSLCLSWSDDHSHLELKQRAAEAFGWLNGTDTTDYKQLKDILINNPEPQVREAANKALEETKKRLWAEEYIHHITKVKGRDNSEILDAWRYGEALARIGDDWTIRALREHLSSALHSPNVRYWIERIIKDTSKQWNKTTQKWSEPWFAWEGKIERGKGIVILTDQVESEIEYTIWHKPPTGPGERHSWGGSIIGALPFTDLKEGSIELEDGRIGQIYFSYTTHSFGEVAQDIGIFRGTGAYPS